MLKRLLTLLRPSDPPPEVEPPRHGQRITRLEIELGEVQQLLDAIWSRQRKVEGAVHGMRGANARHPPRAAHDGETLQEFRDRMQREGLLRAAPHEAGQHGEH